MTVFDVAANDEIRQLFIRPKCGSKRFCNDDDSTNQKKLFTVIHGDQKGSENKKHDDDKDDDNGDDDDDDDDDDSPSKKWVDLVADENYIRGLQISQAVGETLFGSSLARSITFVMFNHLLGDQFRHFENEASVRDFLLRLIDMHVTRNDPEYDKTCELVSEFARKKRIEPLLRLYTLETSLYRQLHYESDAWLLPLVCHFTKLKPRFFRGTSYRGLSMKSQELRAYRLACGKSSCVLRTNTFCSTSTDRHVAEELSNECFNSDLIHVLMIFEFPQPCHSTIRLYAISDKYPSLSNFEDEQVLLLPQTLFHVKRIENDGKQCHTTIWLEHVPPEQHPFQAYIRCIARDIRKQ
ncbi:unnamed protein product [Rotaria socialis]|uniref:Uncharacterized protein n=1 Tax=Rotaria socialis TaxID=392032 RepID=A0A820R9M3_9BILA|nr:unnamed protein product [Rotaria socialis]CAF3333719.1 unnamed protein product [Rotaria socialis]CAF3500040.1 unnamed protein product [Rotaria socialis]CAF3638191.1 unnamed protein product [Rotaria socialis]CAF4437703.1 unnamed protein product [Rotaria socialis]